MITKELLNCPFCGSRGMVEEVIRTNGQGWLHKFYRPKCSNPGCIWDNEFYSEKGAIKEWNLRED